MGGVHSLHSRTSSAGSILSFTSSILSEPISENDPNFEPETDSRGYEIELPSIERLGFLDMPDCIDEQDDNGLELSENGSECNASDDSKVIVIEPLNYEADSEDDHGYSPISSHSEEDGTPCSDPVQNPPDTTSRAESPDLSSDVSQHSSQTLVTSGRHAALKDWSQKLNVMNGDIVKPLVKLDVSNDGENLDINQVSHVYANGDIHDEHIDINGCQSVPTMHRNGENDFELT